MYCSKLISTICYAINKMCISFLLCFYKQAFTSATTAPGHSRSQGTGETDKEEKAACSTLFVLQSAVKRKKKGGKKKKEVVVTTSASPQNPSLVVTEARCGSKSDEQQLQEQEEEDVEAEELLPRAEVPVSVATSDCLDLSPSVLARSSLLLASAPASAPASASAREASIGRARLRRKTLKFGVFAGLTAVWFSCFGLVVTLDPVEQGTEARLAVCLLGGAVFKCCLVALTERFRRHAIRKAGMCLGREHFLVRAANRTISKRTPRSGGRAGEEGGGGGGCNSAAGSEHLI